ncbi:hypothetical protein [Salipiger mucosus]|uniref:DUF5666 domain-containing protein n=1 Tax=Salipiger mucosus DSM 16094 TaxID=1123237 RepID=S9SB81_9RHOB|nr:hypothetical protein [Salipiger mucosus]EPX83489.1 hypothetical protein Salmuc_02097 [Salipiger mucosus DSM 16094]
MKRIALSKGIRSLLATLAATIQALAALPALSQPTSQTVIPDPVISITGYVSDRKGAQYTIRHNNGSMYVDMSGWPQTDLAGNSPGIVGDTITATGDFNAAFLGTRTLEADSVYNFDKRSYRTFVDRAPQSWRAYQIPENDWDENVVASVVGQVAQLGDEQFTIIVADQKIRVSTTPLRYNPLDDLGGLRLTIGDYIRVSGVPTKNFFDKPAIRAHRLTSIDLLKADT